MFNNGKYYFGTEFKDARSTKLGMFLEFWLKLLAVLSSLFYLNEYKFGFGHVVNKLTCKNYTLSVTACHFNIFVTIDRNYWKCLTRLKLIYWILHFSTSTEASASVVFETPMGLSHSRNNECPSPLLLFNFSRSHIAQIASRIHLLHYSYSPGRWNCPIQYYVQSLPYGLTLLSSAFQLLGECVDLL